MKNKLKIFYVSSEVFPFAKTGELGDVSGALPKFVKNLGHDIRVMMPNYKVINERKYVLRDVIRLQGLKVKVGEHEYRANGKSAFIPNSKVQIYFLDNKQLFDREGLYCESQSGKEYEDNAERYIFFSIGCIETLKLLYWQPDIIHCNDWQTALIPILLKTKYREDNFFKNTKTLLSVQSMSDQGTFATTSLQKAGLLDSGILDGMAESNSHFDFLNVGINYADMLNTNSEANTLMMEKSWRPSSVNGADKPQKEKHFVGILNGVDDQVWNPETDKLIPFNFSARELDGKSKNKGELLEKVGLDCSGDVPVISTITRRRCGNGIDIILDIVDDLMKLNVGVIIQGAGDEKYDKKLRTLQKRFNGRLAIDSSFDNSLSHLIQAGSDIFVGTELYSSSQLHSLAYGTIPVVSSSNGATEIVLPFDAQNGTGNGFVFKESNPKDLLRVLESAVKQFQDKEVWNELIRLAMKSNFSWSLSVDKYIKLYHRLAAGKA